MIRLLDDDRIDWPTIFKKHLDCFKSTCLIELQSLKKLDSLEKQFNLYLIDKIKDDSLLIGKPNVLREIRLEFKKYQVKGLIFEYPIPVKKPKKYKRKQKVVKTKYFESLIRIFNYETFRDNSETSALWGAYEYIRSLGVKSCLYCNRNNITLYDRAYELKDKNQRGKVRPALDHLFLQSRYPFFRISLFNLIPSCGECNTSLKGSKIKENIEDHLNPYSESMHELYEFSDELDLKLKNKKFQLSDFDEESFTINFIPKNPVSNETSFSKGEINKELFLIEELYNKQRETLLPIVRNIHFYGFGRIDDLTEKVESLKISTQDWVLTVFGNSINDIRDIKKIPLSKVNHDLAKKYSIKVGSS